MVTLKLEQQLDLERDSLAMGRDRVVAQMERDLRNGVINSTADRMLDEATRDITSAILKLQAQVQAKIESAWGGQIQPNPKWRLMLLSLDAEVLAFLTIRSVLTVINRERSMASVCIRIARAVEDQLWMTEVRALEASASKQRNHAPKNRIPKMDAVLKKYGPRVIKRWRKILDDLPTTVWSKVDKMHLGSELLGAASPYLSGIITVTPTPKLELKGAHRTQKLVQIRPTFIETLAQEAGRVAYMRPFYMPMVTPPVPWDASGTSLSGGYLTLRTPGLKTHAAADIGHTQFTEIGDTHLRAMNKLQSVPWCINGFVLENATRAFQSDIGPVPYVPEVPVPERLDDTLWSSMPKEAQTAHIVSRARAYDHNFRQSEAKLAHTRALTTAIRFKDEPEIYFPHAMDYRGRFYPIPQDLHPQGPDMVKALLRLGTSKRLGERGLVWLEQHTASTYGLDKHDRLTQQTWVAVNWDRIMLVGQDPWLDVEFWCAAEEPWQFLAGAHELWLAYQTDDPEEYHSSLPISVDGSCNGLQHLSAMGLDEIGGHAVNLMGGPRQDIYQIVADKVSASIPPDSPWYQKVTRKTVKRAVMTTPYGVTTSGIADQLRRDGFCDGHEDPIRSSHYLRDLIVEALDGTIVKGMDIMRWFKACCQVLTKDEQRMSWETPSGMVVSMMYLDPGVTRVMTPFGYLSVMKDLGPKSKLKSYKQVNGVSPNIIHSFDAAHLALVINAFDGDIAAVHDSYGTHACDVDDMLRITKEVFVDIYSQNWFQRLRANFIFHSDLQGMPPAPERGDLDITRVISSDYFFA